MNQDNFENIMAKSDRKVYDSFFAKSFSDMGLNGDSFEQTMWQGKPSKNSLSFSVNEMHRLFGFKESSFNWLDKRIRTIHSSALQTLLFFKSMGVANVLEIDGITYNRAFFEVKNKCVETNHPSCVDVMLVSEDEKTLLFLESKFTEYLHVGNRKGINENYRMFYDSLDMFNVNNELELTSTYKNKDGKDVFDLQSSIGKPLHYCEGIKQMISHYIGLLLGPAVVENRDYKRLFEKAENFRLGTILFDFSYAKGKNAKGKDFYDDASIKFDDYRHLYERLAKSLGNLKLPIGRKIQVRKAILTYQEVLRDNPEYVIEDNIKKLYQL